MRFLALLLCAGCAYTHTHGDCNVKQTVTRVTEIVCRPDAEHRAIIVWPAESPHN